MELTAPQRAELCSLISNSGFPVMRTIMEETIKEMQDELFVTNPANSAAVAAQHAAIIGARDFFNKIVDRFNAEQMIQQNPQLDVLPDLTEGMLE